MDTNWAEENLKTIRTLMARSAIYRRALAPIMLFAGIIGFSAAGIGWYSTIMLPTAFVLYWFAVAAVVLAGAFLMVRHQAWRESEAFWSPPTRRIAQAIFPPLFCGFILGIFAIAMDVQDNLPTNDDLPTGEWPPNLLFLQLLPVLWVILYGCAVHSAGFFISRGMRIFGIVIVALGCCALFFTAIHSGKELIHFAYVVMGGFFGVLHLACAAYLYLTEKRKNAT